MLSSLFPFPGNFFFSIVMHRLFFLFFPGLNSPVPTSPSLGVIFLFIFFFRVELTYPRLYFKPVSFPYRRFFSIDFMRLCLFFSRLLPSPIHASPPLSFLGAVFFPALINSFCNPPVCWNCHDSLQCSAFFFLCVPFFISPRTRSSHPLWTFL